MPSTRAALYTIKPSIGLVSQDGIIPVTPLADAAGPMVKSVADLALLLDVLIEPNSPGTPTGGYGKALSTKWSDLRIATLDPEVWKFGPAVTKVIDSVRSQMVSNSINDARLDAKRARSTRSTKRMTT